MIHAAPFAFFYTSRSYENKARCPYTLAQKSILRWFRYRFKKITLALVEIVFVDNADQFPIHVEKEMTAAGLDRIKFKVDLSALWNTR